MESLNKVLNNKYHSIDYKLENDFNNSYENNKTFNKPMSDQNIKFKNHISEEKSKTGINESSDKIHFESNDLLDDYKK